jgi:hypothetical protein
MTEFLLIVILACSVLCIMALTTCLIVAVGILVNHLLERIINHG